MKTALALLSEMLLILTGCSTLNQVDSSHKDQWIAGAQADLLGHDAVVVTTGGRAGTGNVYRLDKDSLCLREEESGSIFAVDLDDVLSIRRPTNAWPVVGGFVGGLFIGGLIGGAVGTDAAVHADNVEEGVSTFVWTPVIGAVVGGLAGASILGLATSTTSYEIVHSPTRRSVAQPGPASPDSK